MSAHMRRAAATLLAAAAGIALVTASGVALAAGPATAASARPARARHHAARPVVLVNCLGHCTVRPRSYVLTCADANDYLTRVHWASWRSTAFGHGTNVVNTCVPSCVRGKFRRYPALTVLWRAKARSHHRGQRYFSRLTLIYTGKVPAGFHRTATFALRP